MAIFFIQYCQNLKKYHPSGNLKFNNLGIFPSLKLRILMGKIPPIPLKLNFTLNTLRCYGLMPQTLRTYSVKVESVRGQMSVFSFRGPNELFYRIFSGANP